MPRTTKAHLEEVNESLANKLDSAKADLSEAQITLGLLRRQLTQIISMIDSLLQEKP